MREGIETQKLEVKGNNMRGGALETGRVGRHPEGTSEG